MSKMIKASKGLDEGYVHCDSLGASMMQGGKKGTSPAEVADNLPKNMRQGGNKVNNKGPMKSVGKALRQV